MLKRNFLFLLLPAFIMSCSEEYASLGWKSNNLFGDVKEVTEKFVQVPLINGSLCQDSANTTSYIQRHYSEIGELTEIIYLDLDSNPYYKCVVKNNDKGQIDEMSDYDGTNNLIRKSKVKQWDEKGLSTEVETYDLQGNKVSRTTSRYDGYFLEYQCIYTDEINPYYEWKYQKNELGNVSIVNMGGAALGGSVNMIRASYEEYDDQKNWIKKRDIIEGDSTRITITYRMIKYY